MDALPNNIIPSDVDLSPIPTLDETVPSLNIPLAVKEENVVNMSKYDNDDNGENEYINIPKTMHEQI